ncbi:MAG TPA: segregation/condensation protein A [Patescibacteria group bacterium]|jgi:segregation and condensation protein A|nr:segregation/condensation protein A [Patescibacteria group bacterium]
MSIKVKLDQFEGPLDLLLQLIEDQQLDITAVSLAAVTEQFLIYIKGLEQKNPMLLGDFLLIAAKLLVIKSKALLPQLVLEDVEEDAAFDLTQRLLTYKKFKEAAKLLKRLDLKRRQSWIRESESDRITFLPDPSITPQLLSQSLKKVAEELKEIIKLPKQIMAEVVSISEKIAHIQQLITGKIQTSLSELIKGSKNKTEVIVTFLALLELIKQRTLTVEQNEMFSDIIIKKTVTS